MTPVDRRRRDADRSDDLDPARGVLGGVFLAAVVVLLVWFLLGGRL